MKALYSSVSTIDQKVSRLLDNLDGSDFVLTNDKKWSLDQIGVLFEIPILNIEK